jgi:C-terminal processing protease CtpA/Prc
MRIFIVFLTFIVLFFNGCSGTSVDEFLENEGNQTTQQESNITNDSNETNSSEDLNTTYGSEDNVTQEEQSDDNVTEESDNNTTQEEESDEQNTSNDVVFDIEQKNFLIDIFNNDYLWYDRIDTDVDLSSYTDPQTMIDDIKYYQDKWSFVYTMEDYNNSANQISSGFGCYFMDDIIAYMDIDSPCEQAGLQRGDQILLVNGLNPSYTYYSAMLNDGVASIITVSRDDETLSFIITPSVYSYKSMKASTLYEHNKTIGHLIFNEFTESSVDEMEEIFHQYKEQNVSELIVDLRYNGGGSLATASIFMDYIAGSLYENQIQFYIKNNDKNSRYDEAILFFDDNDSLSLERIFFLTSEYSASASELIIHALDPYIDVVTIGQTTHGKPVGMEGKEKEELIYFLITFELTNVNGEGSYFEGLSPDCIVEDNIDYLRTDINGSMLSEALYYIKNGSCK